MVQSTCWRRAALAALTLLWAAGAMAAPAITYPQKPITHSKPKPHTCVNRHNARDGSLVFLINGCEELVYVSVVEYRDLAERTCAVFGLQTLGDGKAYGPGEWYVEDSLRVSRSPGRALSECQRSGYETVGGGQGMFIRIADAQAYTGKSGKRAPARKGKVPKEPEEPASVVVEYTCEDCDQQLVTLTNGLALAREQSATFLPLMKQTIAKIESMIKRRRLRQEHLNLAFVIRNDQRQIWEQAEPDFRQILETGQWDAFLVLRTYVDAQFGTWEAGFSGKDYVFDVEGGQGTAAPISVN